MAVGVAQLGNRRFWSAGRGEVSVARWEKCFGPLLIGKVGVCRARCAPAAFASLMLPALFRALHIPLSRPLIFVSAPRPDSPQRRCSLAPARP